MWVIEDVIAALAFGKLAMTKRIKAPSNDKEGKAGVSVGKKYKYKDVGYRVCDCHACRRQARNDRRRNRITGTKTDSQNSLAIDF